MSSVYCTKCGGMVSFEGAWGGTINWCTCPKESVKGWECPRCHQIHSPHSAVCNCPPQLTTRNTNTSV